VQVSTSLRIAQNSAVRDAVAAHGEASAAQEENLVKDLALLTTSIAAATEHELHEPDSEGRMAIDVLVNLAAVPGPAGALARGSLYRAYEELSFSGNQAGCHALHNAALHMCEQTIFKTDENLSMTVAYLGGRAGQPPWGSNGPGKTDIFNSYIIRKLPAALEHEVDILDPGRRLTDTEVHAALAQFDNLGVQPEPIPVAGSAPDSQQGLDQWLDAAAQQARSSNKPVACVVNRRTRSGPGQVAALAAPKAGHVQWQLLTPQAGNSGGQELAKAVKASLDASSSNQGPAVIHMLPPSADADPGVQIMMALDAVNKNPDDLRGQGAVIEEHIAQSSQSSPEMQQGAALLTRARALEATQAELPPHSEKADEPIGSHDPRMPAIVCRLPFDVSLPQPESPVNRAPHLPISPLPKPVASAESIDQNKALLARHAAHNLRVVVKSHKEDGDRYHIQSSMLDLSTACDAYLDSGSKWNMGGNSKAYKEKLARLKPLGVDDEFPKKAAAYVNTIKQMMGKSDLFKVVDAPEPLKAASGALNQMGSLAALSQLMTRMDMALNGCYDHARKREQREVRPGDVELHAGEIAKLQQTLLDQIATAVTELQKVESAPRTSDTSKRWANDAKTLIKALADLKELATHPIFTRFAADFGGDSEESQLALKQTLEALPRP
jgi:hypothetical protein